MSFPRSIVSLARPVQRSMNQSIRCFATASKSIYTAKTHTVGGRNGSAKSDDGNLSVTLSVPKSMGGPGGAGTNPEQLFAAGYSACFLGAMGLMAKNSNQTLPSNTSIDAKVDLNKGDMMDLSVHFIVKAPGLEKSALKEIVDKAHEFCPYSRATRGNIKVTFELQ